MSESRSAAIRLRQPVLRERGAGGGLVLGGHERAPFRRCEACGVRGGSGHAVRGAAAVTRDLIEPASCRRDVTGPFRSVRPVEPHDALPRYKPALGSDYDGPDLRGGERILRRRLLNALVQR